MSSCFKRITGSLSDYSGQLVSLLGKFVKLEPNGRVFSMQSLSGDVITVQLQEPSKMRLVILKEDIYLQREVKVASWFNQNEGQFPKMWKEQGKTFWLRFLFTFESSKREELKDFFGEDNLSVTDEILLNLILIYFHRKCIEADVSAVLDLMRQAANTVSGSNEKWWMFHGLSEGNDLKQVDSALKLFEKGERHICSVEFPFGAATHIAIFFGVCEVFRRWLKETDLPSDLLKDIDYKQAYWQPPENYAPVSFKPNCFHKYCSDYWKSDLPKALMTRDVHNIFSAHPVSCYCHSLGNYEQDVSKDPKPLHRLNMVKFLYPIKVACSNHRKCFVKVRHKCEQPYLCEGSNKCTQTCEVECKNNSYTLKNYSFCIEAFNLKKNKKKRHVAVAVDSNLNSVETYLLSKEEVKSEAQDLQEYLMLLSNTSMYESRNRILQYKRKFALREKLSKKIQDKVDLDLKNFEDENYLLQLKSNAEVRLHVLSFTSGAFHSESCKSDCNFLSVMNSVAVGTQDIHFGKVVCPSASKDTVRAQPSDDVKKVKPKKEKQISVEKVLDTKAANNNSQDAACSTDEVIPSALKDTVKTQPSNNLKNVKPKTEKQVSVEKAFDTKATNSNSQDAASSSKEVLCHPAFKETVNAQPGNDVKKVKPKNEKQTSVEKVLDIKSANNNSQGVACSSNEVVGPAFKDTVRAQPSNDVKKVKPKNKKQTPVENIIDTNAAINNSLDAAFSANEVEIKSLSSVDDGEIKEINDVECANGGSSLTEDERSILYSLQKQITSQSVAIFQKFSEIYPEFTEILEAEHPNWLDTHLSMDAQERIVQKLSNLYDSSKTTDLVKKIIPTDMLTNLKYILKTFKSIKEKEMKPTNETLSDKINNVRQCLTESEGKNACKSEDVSFDKVAAIALDTNSTPMTSNGDNKVPCKPMVTTKEVEITSNHIQVDKCEQETQNETPVLVNGLGSKPPSEEEHASCNQNGLPKKHKFKTCAFCSAVETQPKTFKRCARCKTDNFPEHNYYCSRHCQTEDWLTRHGGEHSNGIENSG